jgi:hexokinase
MAAGPLHATGSDFIGAPYGIIAATDMLSTLNKLSAQFTVSKAKLKNIVSQMLKELKTGLQKDDAAMKMIPSYVVSLPTGSEVKYALALDVGGTNFRILLASFEGSGRVRTKHRKFLLTDADKRANGAALFDFFAKSVEDFLKDEKLEAGPHTLGFTFSFAVRQTAINRGVMMAWNKGFSNEGVVGEDVVELLQNAFRRRGLNISVAALANDTVGTLVTHSYKDPQTYVSVILGTGTNAAYVESASEIPKWPSNDGILVINTEWGGYSDISVLPVTTYDKTLDQLSANPEEQLFEKLISGLYLGEIIRIVIMELVASGDLFAGKSSIAMYSPHTFLTAYMSRIERDHSLDLIDTKSVLEDVMGIPSTSFNDRRIVKHMCELVGTRAARLAAAGIVALVTKINRLDACTVAIDGSLYEHYPHFGNRMRDALRELLGITAENIILEQARDGSGQGAALIAALHNEYS